MNEIVKHDGRAAAGIPIRSVDDLLSLGGVLAASNFFKSTMDENQAAAKILAGMELGISPVASLRGIYIVEGQISLAYPMIGALIKRSGKYDFRIRENTAEACEVEFFEHGESVGFTRLTMKQAKERGLDQYSAGKIKEPWRKFPENMLLSKCLSNGAKAYTSEVFYGSVYTPDELGAEIDGNTGFVIEIESSPEPELKLRKLILCEGEGCESQNGLIVDFTNEAGKTMSAESIEKGTRDKYGIPLCWDCAQKYKKAAEMAGQGALLAEVSVNRQKAEERDRAKDTAGRVDAITAKENLLKARQRYEEAAVSSQILGLTDTHNPDYLKWPTGKLLTEAELLTAAIQKAITTAALQDDAFLAEEDENDLPSEDEPLVQWMSFAAAWELTETIRVDNQARSLNDAFELDDAAILEEIPN